MLPTDQYDENRENIYRIIRTKVNVQRIKILRVSTEREREDLEERLYTKGEFQLNQ